MAPPMSPTNARWVPMCTCFIIPPYMQDYLRRNCKDARLLRSLAATAQASARLRQMRAAMLATPRRMARSAAAPAPTKLRRVFDCGHSTDLLRTLVRSEGQKRTKDKAVNEAYDHSGTTFDFFDKVYGRAGIDQANLPMTSSVHYEELPGEGYDNAFWDGRQMVYGDGTIFNRMTIALDIVAHELTHGVTQFEAGLAYENQSGALNEHFSDVFGVLARQWRKKQTDPANADWSVGRGIFRKASMKNMSLRSMSAPGSAYDDPDFGKDEQPDHMSRYVKLPNTEEGDWGGVHYNSGIPNKAFHLAAVAIGKPAWEVAGKIWYVTLTERLRDNANFKKCAYETISVAGDYFGAATRKAVRDAWQRVGVIKGSEGPMQG
jgi:Zn-dependent metalloprotease